VLLLPTLKVVCLAAISVSPNFKQDHARELTQGLSLERELSAGENQAYTVRLESGGGIIAEARQEGIPVEIEITDPDGAKIATVDSPNDVHAPAAIRITVDKEGVYRFVVHSLDPAAKPGKYVLKVDRILSLADNAEEAAKELYDSPTMFELWKNARSDVGAVDKLLSDRAGKGPIIEEFPGDKEMSLVTFLYKGDPDTLSVTLNGGPDGAVGGSPLDKFKDTNLFYRSVPIPKDARFGYMFTVVKRHLAGPDHSVDTREANAIADPLNPNAYYEKSTLTLPEAPAQPYSDPVDSVAKGVVKSTSLKSAILGEDRHVYVYTPADYDGKQPCELVIAFDGERWGGVADQIRVPVPTLLDNLQAQHKIPPTVAILVDAMGLRNRDLTCNKPFADFVAQELTPWARKTLNIKPGAEHVTVAGSSFGGTCSAYCGLTHSETIGNVVAMSGVYTIAPGWQTSNQPYRGEGTIIDGYRKSKRLPLRFYIDVGRFDFLPVFYTSARELRDILTLKGNPVTYEEFDGGHDPLQWRGALANGFIAVLNH